MNTKQDIIDLQRRNPALKIKGLTTPADPAGPGKGDPVTRTKKTYRSALPWDNNLYDSRTEALYAEHLESMKRELDILDWRYDVINLRLADRTFYKPDFLVISNSTRIEVHEVKGFMRDDANVKLKTAASLFPWFAFYLVRRIKGTWQITRVGK